MSQSLSPVATEVLMRLRYFDDPLVASLPPGALLESLCELEAAGLIEPANGRVNVTATGWEWGRVPGTRI